jgi:hypothetical protein
MYASLAMEQDKPVWLRDLYTLVEHARTAAELVGQETYAGIAEALDSNLQLRPSM